MFDTSFPTWYNTISLNMNKSDIFRFIILRTIGNFLVLFSVFGVIATFGPAMYYEVKFHISQVSGVHYIVKVTPKASLSPEQFSNVLSKSNEHVLIPPDTDFSIVIPKIGASEKVFPNVDPNNENEYLPILLKGVAHAKGTSFPGFAGNTYLFAHSADNFWDVGRYNAVFYLIKDLEKGDDVIIFFENKRFNYTVVDSQIVDQSDVTRLTKSTKDQNLILQTCWPPGTTWKRLIVTARPK